HAEGWAHRTAQLRRLRTALHHGRSYDGRRPYRPEHRSSDRLRRATRACDFASGCECLIAANWQTLSDVATGECVRGFHAKAQRIAKTQRRVKFFLRQIELGAPLRLCVKKTLNGLRRKQFAAGGTISFRP